MMSGIIRSLLRTPAWSLIALICANLLANVHCDAARADCFNELFIQLNAENLASVKQVENKLREVDVKERHSVRIGRASVAQLLSLKDGSCSPSLTGLDARLHELDFICDGQRNRGAEMFLQAYWPTWTKSCAKAMRSLYKQTLKEFPKLEKKIVESIKLHSRHEHLAPGVAAARLIQESESDTKRKDVIISACGRLIEKLVELDSHDVMKVVSSAQSTSFTKIWNFRREVCRFHLTWSCITPSDDEHDLCKEVRLSNWFRSGNYNPVS